MHWSQALDLLFCQFARGGSPLAFLSSCSQQDLPLFISKQEHGTAAGLREELGQPAIHRVEAQRECPCPRIYLGGDLQLALSDLAGFTERSQVPRAMGLGLILGLG